MSTAPRCPVCGHQLVGNDLEEDGEPAAPQPPDPDDEPTLVEPNEMLGLPAFGFADPGPLRDELTASVVAGSKEATSSLVADYIIDGMALPTIGERSVVYDSMQRPVAIVETTAWRLATIGTVDDEFARAEGEGYADAAAWREAHERYWNGYLAGYRRELGDPGFRLAASTPVICEWFRLVARLDPGTGEPIETGRREDAP